MRSHVSTLRPYRTHGSKPHKRGGGEKYERSFIVMIVIHAFDLYFFTPEGSANGRLTNLHR